MPNIVNRQETLPVKRQEFKASPEVMQLIFLDELAGRLAMLQQTIESQHRESTPQGLTDYFMPTVTPQAQIFRPEREYERWHSVEIQNTGANDLYFLTNGKSRNSEIPTVSAGDSFHLNPQRNIISHIILWTPAGKTTTVTMICLK